LIRYRLMRIEKYMRYVNIIQSQINGFDEDDTTKCGFTPS